MPDWLIKLLGSGVVASLLVAILGFAWDRAAQSGMDRAALAYSESSRVKDGQIAALEAALAAKQADAVAGYIERIEARQPIVARSREVVYRYAQTDAGRRECLEPERVRGIVQTAADYGIAIAVDDDSGTTGSGS